MAQAYCVKCKRKREMQGERETEIRGKGGTRRKALTGSCPECRTKMFKFVKG